MFLAFVIIAVLFAWISIPLPPEHEHQPHKVKSSRLNAFKQVSNHSSVTSLPEKQAKKLCQIFAARRDALNRLQGSVKVSDLIFHPVLERQIVALVAWTSDFDDNSERLSITHKQSLTNAQILTVEFCKRFNVLLAQTKNSLCQPHNPRINIASQGESSRTRDQRQGLTSTLHETKIDLFLIAKEIIYTLRFLFRTSLADLDAAIEQHNIEEQVKSSHLKFLNGSISAEQLLTTSNFPSTHPQYTSIHSDLQLIAKTQTYLEEDGSHMRRELATLHNMLQAFVDELEHLDLGNIGSKAGRLVACIRHIDSWVKSAVTRCREENIVRKSGLGL